MALMPDASDPAWDFQRQGNTALGLAAVALKRAQRVRRRLDGLNLDELLRLKTGPKGDKGDKGDQGDEGRAPNAQEVQWAVNTYLRVNPPEPGPAPVPEWDGTRLRFIDPRTGSPLSVWVDLKGADGRNGGFGIGGGRIRTRTVHTVTQSYSLVASDDVVLADASAGDLTLTLPEPGNVTGETYTTKVRALPSGSPSGFVYVTSPSGTVEGLSQLRMDSQYSSADWISDGTDWWIV